MRVTTIVKATLHSVNRRILRCILIVFYIINQNQRLIVFCFAVIAHIALHAYEMTSFLYFTQTFQDVYHILSLVVRCQGAVAMPLGIQAVPRSFPASGTFSREDLLMKLFLRPFFLCR